MTGTPSCQRLVSLTLDEVTLGRGSPDLEHERRVAIFDLLQDNLFDVFAHLGPFHLSLALHDQRLVLAVHQAEGALLVTHHLAFSSFRRLMRDYLFIIQSYHEAIARGSLQDIEAIDMGRRGLHNELATLLMQRLDGKICLDLETARRFITLLVALMRVDPRPAVS